MKSNQSGVWSHNTHKKSCPRKREHMPAYVEIGNPKPTGHYTVDQLKEMGMIGLYVTGPVDKRQLHIL